jgi:hypothetical protein
VHDLFTINRGHIRILLALGGQVFARSLWLVRNG